MLDPERDIMLELLVNGKRRRTYFPDIHVFLGFAVWMMHIRIRGESPLHVVDVGGCVGAFSLAALVRGTNATFDVVEPAEWALPYLHYNLGGIENVSIHEVGVSRQRGFALLYRDDENFGKSNIYEGTDCQQIELTTLDELIEKPVNLLKIDVEGHEWEVLMGAENILDRYHPKLILEIKEDHLERAGHKASDITEYLRKFGYRDPSWLSPGYDYWYD